MELYNEIINDLLAEDNTNLEIRENNTRGIYIEGLKEITVMNEADAIALL